MKWRKNLADNISTIAINEFKGNFRQGGWRDGTGVTKWKDRSKKDKNKKKRALLVKSGRLKRSLRKASDFNTARVVTDVKYAQIHNEGGKISGTFDVKLHRIKKKKGGFAIVKGHSRKVNTTIPERPFMKMGAGLRNDIDKFLSDGINQVFK